MKHHECGSTNEISCPFAMCLNVGEHKDFASELCWRQSESSRECHLSRLLLSLLLLLQVDHATAGDLHVGVPSRNAAAKSELKLRQPSLPHMNIDKNGDQFTPRSSDYQVHFPMLLSSL